MRRIFTLSTLLVSTSAVASHEAHEMWSMGDEYKVNIFTHLSARDLNSAAQVNQDWNRIVNDKFIRVRKQFDTPESLQSYFQADNDNEWKYVTELRVLFPESLKDQERQVDLSAILSKTPKLRVLRLQHVRLIKPTSTVIPLGLENLFLDECTTAPNTPEIDTYLKTLVEENAQRLQLLRMTNLSKTINTILTALKPETSFSQCVQLSLADPYIKSWDFVAKFPKLKRFKLQGDLGKSTTLMPATVEDVDVAGNRQIDLKSLMLALKPSAAKLTKLDLSSIPLKEMPKNLEQFPQLKKLVARKTNLTMVTEERLPSSLEILDIGENDDLKELAQGLLSLQNLKTINIEDSNAIYSLPYQLAQKAKVTSSHSRWLRLQYFVMSLIS